MTEHFVDRVSILRPTNTQTRRLSYLTQICKMLGESAYPTLNLITDLEIWAAANQELLDSQHVSNKGAIRPSAKSLGAKRYVQLAEELELITQSSGFLRLTKTGRLLVTSNEECLHEKSPIRPFELKPKERTLLTYELLLLDSDYLLPILQLTSTHHSQMELQELTQSILLKRLEVLGRHSESPLVRSEIGDRITSVTGWKKPKKYSEHIVLPRLHWLLDLELLDWSTFKSKKEFVLSVAGQLLLQCVPLVDGERVVDRGWCQNEFFGCWAELLGNEVRRWTSIPTSEQDSLINTHVLLGFSHFRTMEYPRISAYQLVLFTVIRLMLCENIAAGFEQIKQALSRGAASGEWVFYWTAIDDDGYVLLSR